MFLIIGEFFGMSSRALLFLCFFGGIGKEKERAAPAADKGVVCLPDPPPLAPGEFFFIFSRRRRSSLYF